MNTFRSIYRNIKKNFLIDISNTFFLLIGTFTAIYAYLIASDPSKSVNTNVMLGISIITTFSSILDSLVNVIKIKKKISAEKIKIFTTFSGVIMLLIFLIISIIDNDFWSSIQSFSKRGGFTLITSTLLMLKIAESRIILEIVVKKENQAKINELLDKHKILLESQKSDKEKIKKLLQDNNKK